MEQMVELEKIGLANIKERNSHRECGYGVEELLQILPACIAVDGWCYCLKLYKSAFDVQHIAYVAHKNPKTGVADYLHSIGCDDVMPKDESYSGHLVDALFEMVLWVNNNYKEYLTEHKEKLNHYIQSM